MLNPQTTDIQFNGSVGAVAISLGLPALLTVFGIVLNSQSPFKSGIPFPFDWSFDRIANAAFDKNTWIAYTTYFFGFVVLDQLVPGKYIKGVVLRDKTQLTYKINGLNFILVIVTVLLARLYALGSLPELEFIYEHQLELTLTCCLFSFALAVFVYIYSFFPLKTPNGLGTNDRILAEPGNSGRVVYDWFIGRELNPRIGSWDIKLFCELKPGLVLWLLINVSCLYSQYLQHGTISDSMLLINFLQGFYIFDGILNEEGLLTMMDVVTDGFGNMLAFGDLALVPWAYSLQARYLSLNYIDLGWPYCAATVAIAALGYYVFHSANQQKSDFKQGKLAHLKSMKTVTGSNLLVDGWWKLSQHINYLGDWLIGLSWCLATGFNTPLTYFYAVYFASLLVHRQVRDDEKCASKYKQSWDEYKARVPYKIIPYLY
ncbi:erg24, C-14 sterol reductase [Yamadazyma tenuis]|uniref:Delta(14)-sterol reductase n=1 Tax=Candida tenuis (strain ATCC 10573 / BCRC 21748 / CBS 615 / JCM 9827 / NBRC 10315 / NRRL Y-1498 / VKM Y-70) TaxID=590646 RepID=G3BC19_CANTC|nr:uncharacterized protein CANTEDRAFT_137235 [Yamadazyma tenuis ATCC 10573]XP_006689973.1 sterol C-14 reductase [Yamadazyma tenuis ATCC 10573]EGV60758.1 hypothetical protein CANTEDRAFT_137235 [Yamadazyma tenuis ATCC 10573]EGV60759.1 sterol C-14 reductase [Yamadazyma tenuis ATCC 10573]WEJ93966.1 erg24, C-14 sterol reductase [Yamadazyma tenuis]